MRKGTNPPRRFICQHCGNPFERVVYPSSVNLFLFCSPACRNAARALADIPCPVCGKMFRPRKINGKGKRPKTYCSQTCARKASRGRISPKRTSEQVVTYVREHYPDGNLDDIAERVGLSKQAVHIIATKNGIKRSSRSLRRQYDYVSRLMTERNPMHNPASVLKVRQYWHDHPKEYATVLQKMIAAQSRLNKKTPTKLETRLCSYLDALSIDYEHQYIIKDKFIVDVRIGNLIIEADGDWWHGHPRFEPLNERQIKQQKRDAARNKYLTTCGYIVVRIWESDMSLEYVSAILRQHKIIA